MPPEKLTELLERTNHDLELVGIALGHSVPLISKITQGSVVLSAELNRESMVTIALLMVHGGDHTHQILYTCNHTLKFVDDSTGESHFTDEQWLADNLDQPFKNLP